MATPSANDAPEEVVVEPEEEDMATDDADVFGLIGMREERLGRENRYLSRTGHTGRGRSPALVELDADGSEEEEIEVGSEDEGVEESEAGSEEEEEEGPEEALLAALQAGIDEAKHYSSDNFRRFVPIELGDELNRDSGPSISRIQSEYTVDFLAVHGTGPELAMGRMLRLENCRLKIWAYWCMDPQHRYFWCKGPVGKVRQPASAAAPARSLQ